MVKVRLISNMPIAQAVYAARVCADSQDQMKCGLEADVLPDDEIEFLKRRILSGDNMNPAHESVIEHVVYTFLIDGVSRALLQELMRHRIASPSVQSTRYALKKLLRKVIKPEHKSTSRPLLYYKLLYDDESHCCSHVQLDNLLVLTGDEDVDDLSRTALTNVIDLLSRREVPNDRIKFALPEAFKTRVMLTINARSLRNLFVLRTSKRSLWEIRRMAFAMVDSLPDGHKFLYEDRVHDRPSRFRKWAK